MRTSVTQARHILYLLVTMLARDPASPFQVKLKTLHDANRSHVRSDGLVKSPKGGG